MPLREKWKRKMLAWVSANNWSLPAPSRLMACRPLLKLSSSFPLPFLLDIAYSQKERYEFTEDYNQCPGLKKSKVNRHIPVLIKIGRK
jgi:hypothetical protein